MGVRAVCFWPPSTARERDVSDDDKDSKTELPTEKKIRDAMEKGNTPFSREITIFASTLAIYLFLVFFMPGGVSRMNETLRDFFEQPEAWNLKTGTDVIAIFRHLGWEAGAMLLPILAMMMLFGIASSVLQNLPSPVMERVRPQISRLSPMKGLSRLFGKQGLVEFGKSLIKILIVSLVVAFAMRGDYFASLDTMFSEPAALVYMMTSDINKVLLIILFATALIAGIDFAWTRHHWFSELMMTKQEVKEEMKQSQGDPIVKARMRSIQRDRARRRMITAVPRATLVIANPTHFAVALRYVREEGDAPVIVAKGQDLVALKIREIAEENGIPVFEDPPLARSMFAQVSVDSVIPPVFYKAVAELIHRVYAASPQTRRVN
ncbi:MULTISPECIES: flagellar biosynthesis protein FlhB [unclassified Shinella]|jgi:flagellar biosynthetic protein FlhB|uniref:flagellar biosynthesis protein FlhB n=1 Tax=unclassified Shinella TaxID=2643062 RepID=UPI0009E09839|nr:MULTISPECIES: flagellar biosynthesis protein FlhB [unclassified Shinella]MCA0341682.1 flagellar biosynthesis protein FlhB [Pseudomonadota bacterium]MCO5152752.1 flagellar biosynthesis protein FlhB [Shinella sp.]MDC7260744.1 flagellar biosynthesis protein FlhB [Shinella sp. HY16]MDC7267639.1 flagellar biosynthesis protein FlhB [Shinella sp. YZ44]MDG4672230.1 flagellar biosynthesis protein FlhB [Shinella sp. 838]